MKEFLEELIRNPLQTDIERFVAAGVLCEEKEEPDPNYAKIYIRSTVFDSVEDFKASVLKFMQQYLGNIPLTITLLSAVATPRDEILQEVRSALEPHGLADCAELFFANLDFTSVRIEIDANRCIFLSYAGYTVCGTPESRLKDDLEDKWRLFSNFAKSSDVRWSVYRIIALDYVVTDRLAIRIDPVIGHIEASVIDCICGLSLNSARGGWRAEFLPTDTDRTVIEDALRSSKPPQMPIFEHDEELAKKLSQLIDNEIAMWENVRPGSAQISDVARSELKRALTLGARRLNGSVLCVTNMKDITEENFRGLIRGNFGEPSGRATQLDRYVQSFFYPEIPDSGDLSDEVIAECFGCYLNFWRVILYHLYCEWSKLLSSRLLVLLRPIIWVTWSTRITETARRGEFKSCWEHVPDAEKAAFLAGEEVDMDDLLPYNPDYADILPKPAHSFDALSQVGTISIVPFCEGPCDIALNVPKRHPGNNKYDPALATYNFRLSYLSQGVLEVLKNTVSSEQMVNPIQRDGDHDTTWSWLNGRRITAESTAVQSGLRTAIDDVKEELYLVQSTLQILRLETKPTDVAERTYVIRCEPIRAAFGEAARLSQGLGFRRQEVESTDGGNPPNLLSLVPFGMDARDQVFLDFIVGLADGADIVRVANSMGRSEEAQARVKANQEKFKRWNTEFWKPDDPEERLAKLIKSEENTITNGILKALNELSDPEMLKNFRGQLRNDTAGFREVFRYTTCSFCDRLVFGFHNKSKHTCAAGERFLIPSQFPDLRRLIYAHDILNNPLFAGRTGGHGLIPHNVRRILEQNADSLPEASYEDIPSELNIWARPQDNESWLFVLAFDAAFPYISEAPIAYRPRTGFDENWVWSQPSFKLIYEAMQSTFLRLLSFFLYSQVYCRRT